MKQFRNALLWLGLVFLLLYRFRRWIFAKFLNLSDPQNSVNVDNTLHIPMQDGVLLVADHYAPSTAGSYPTVLIRSPYGRNAKASVFGFLLAFIAQRFAERGYHVLIQDVRGRFDSQGEFNPYFNEKQDGLDTLAWLERQPWFNGVVGTWVFDPNFHIENHIFKTIIEPPGTDEQLRMLVGHLLSSMLNRSKPLWEIHMIEGLEHDRTAFFFKVHHCMVDGLAAVELFTLLFDLTPDVTPFEKKPLYDPPPIPETNELIIDSIKRDIPHKWNLLKKIGQDLTTVSSVLFDKEQRRKTLYGAVNLINDNLRPIKKLPINGKNSGLQELAWAEFSLAEIRAIKSNRGASINDIMLTILTGAVARYIEDVDPGNQQEFFRLLVPVSMRVEKEREDFGNRISVLPIDVPFSIKNPLEQLEAVTQYTKVMKESSLSIGLDMLLTLPSLAPSFVQPLIWGAAPIAFQILAHTWCTNVAGPMIPVYFHGHKLLNNYGFFPLNPSMGLACVIVSYNQRISMTLVSDKAIVPDVRQIQDYLHEAYTALRTAAKVQPIEPMDIEREPKKITPPVVEEVVEIQPEPEEPEEGTPKLFSDRWAKAYMDVLNESKAYYDASTKWTAGSLAMVMEASPKHDFPQATAVLLDLHQGKCREAKSLTVNQAHREATFVLEGDYENWMKVLRGEAQPLAMIIRRKLKLKKGSIARLMPFTQSAQELIKCAQTIT